MASAKTYDSLLHIGSSVKFAASGLATGPALRAAACGVRGTAMNVPLPCPGEGEADASGLLLPEEVPSFDISPKTPPARPRICSDAEEEGAAKMVRVSTGSDLTRVSPSRLRMTASSRLRLPPFVSQVNLPLLDVVTAASS